MGAYSGTYFCGYRISKLGHEVRLMPPAYFKLLLKLLKNDMQDAEAIREVAQRPAMRFVSVTIETRQRVVVVFRIRKLLIWHRTQTINALRGHGEIFPMGLSRRQ
jgi:transposase